MAGYTMAKPHGLTCGFPAAMTGSPEPAALGLCAERMAEEAAMNAWNGGAFHGLLVFLVASMVVS